MVRTVNPCAPYRATNEGLLVFSRITIKFWQAYHETRYRHHSSHQHYYRLILVLILLHTWRTRTTYPGFVVWIAATACWSVGSLLNLMLPNIQPQFIPKIIGNGLIMLHPFLLYEGIYRFHGLRRRWWGTPLNCVLLLSGLLYLIYFLYFSNDITARIIGINSVLVIFFTRTSIEPLLHAGCRHTPCNGCCQSVSCRWLPCLLPDYAIIFPDHAF